MFNFFIAVSLLSDVSHPADPFHLGSRTVALRLFLGFQLAQCLQHIHRLEKLELILIG